MRVAGIERRSIWLDDDGWRVCVIDQTRLPFAFAVARLSTVQEAAEAIRAMLVRGAPLIGATAAYGVALAMRQDASDAALDAAHALLLATRPTAINLAWALREARAAVQPLPRADRAAAAYAHAAALCDADVACNRRIGEHGLTVLRARAAERRAPLQVLTHCNAGWIATVDLGTALAPIYLAHDAGLPVHVWVDETRPRNQGAGLTAWELGQHGVPHTVIADNAGGHLMQRDRVDLVIVGTDRTTATGDVCNKIGTYLKALAAHAHGVPFYVAAPSSSIDWSLRDGVRDIPIEERAAREQSHVVGRSAAGEVVEVQVVPDGSAVANFAFDVTPARYITALITERGVAPASAAGLAELFPERRAGAEVR
jgi:methylthioribose-1-phosphate isomerase